MTASEQQQYGANLSIWEKLALIQAWAPLLTFGQQYLSATDPFAKGIIVSELAEWLASKTDSSLDDELVRHLAAMLKTPQGESLVRWAVGKVEGMKS
jgi:hypothetical protein